jgi:hypothetical protein
MANGRPLLIDGENVGLGKKLNAVLKKTPIFA